MTRSRPGTTRRQAPSSCESARFPAGSQVPRCRGLAYGDERSLSPSICTTRYTSARGSPLASARRLQASYSGAARGGYIAGTVIIKAR